MALRLAGVEYRQIAEQIGYRNVQSAWAAVQAALRRDIRDSAGHELFANLKRLDQLLLAWWPQATAADPEASRQTLAILAERAKLLGLYPAPGSRRQEHIDEELLAREVRRAAADLGLTEAEVMAEAMGILGQKR